MITQLLRLETRRSVGAWLVLAIPVALWTAYVQGLPKVAPLWFETSLIARSTIVILGPLVGGAAAWVAGRDARRGLGDLLATTACPPTARLLTAWLGTTLWGLLGYLVAGGVVVFLSATQATWGGPYVGPMLVGLVAVPVCAALGFALGYHLPNRFTTPLVAVALLVGQVIIGSLSKWYAFLSPLVSLSSSVWYGVTPELSGHQLAFLAGLGGLALGSVALRAQPGRLAQLACVALACITLASVALLFRAAPDSGGQSNVGGPPRPIPYTPICADAAVTVCVHPAYQPYLGDASGVINRLIAPVIGLPGVPTRAEQGFGPIQPDAPLRFNLFPQDEYRQLANTVVHPLIQDVRPFPDVRRTDCPDQSRQSCLVAQVAIGRWLLWQAGLPDENVLYSTNGADPAKAAADRFAALDPAQQRAWLEAHFADLRAGKVRLEDLP